MSKVKRKNRALKWVLVIACAPVAIFLFFFVVGVIVSPQDESDTNVKNEVNAKEATVAVMNSEVTKKEFDLFKTSLLNESTLMLENETNFVEFVEIYTSGAADRVEAYQYAKQYRDALYAHREKVEAIKIDDRFPEEISAYMTEGKSKIIDGISMKSTAVGALLDFMDEGKTSQLAEYKEYSPLYLVGLKTGMEEINEADKLINAKDNTVEKASE
jgi:hypothetical protein